MSQSAYCISKILNEQAEFSDDPFCCLIMAAARRADGNNFNKLESAFPDLIIELEERYNNPGGLTNVEIHELYSE